ncbi:MAG TPA: endonuclease V [Rhodothermales bacterium]|nr:endonuclease V [Rhodothermales bacterium]
MTVRLKHAHRWDLSPRDAIQMQRELVPLVREVPLTKPVTTVAGVDVSIRGDRAQAAIVVVDVTGMQVVDRALWQGDVQFPYIPGLLSFREMPAILPALERLRVWPDVFMTDSQGRAHPRRFGLACHLGVVLEWPSFGVAKSILTGRYHDLSEEKGSHVPLVDKGEIVGEAVRTRSNTNPVYASVGHLMTLEDAVALTLACTTKYKIPEPTREAHTYSKYGS